MINIRLEYNNGYKWFSKDGIFVKGYIFDADNQLFKEDGLIDYFSTVLSFSDFQAKLRQANGSFSVVIKKDDEIWAAVDHARIFPLFYYQAKDFFEITDNPGVLIRDDVSTSFEENNAIMLRYCGFVPGNKTLLKDVFQLQSGESLHCHSDGKLEKEFHSIYLTDQFFNESREELKERLKIVLDNVGKRLVKMLDNRPVAIPLSGGFDSRAIAYLLRENNYPNVLCFTYGLQGNVEVANAKQTAEKLGYEWYFVDYEKYFNYSLAKDSLFNEYADFSGVYCHKFYTQDYFATQDLLKQNKVPANTVFISGHSGAIAGHLLTKSMIEPDFSFPDFVEEKIFSFVYPRKKDLKIIRKEVDFLHNRDKKYPSYLLYENWRFQETTAKIGLNATRLWDFLGYHFSLPLWDKELFDFFVHVPFEHKYDKNLYIEVLSELFKEFDIYFPRKELFASDKLLKKVSFRSKLKKQFPFLKRFVDIWKNDNIGSRYYTREFIQDLKKENKYRKMLSVNGIYSAWYVEKVRKIMKNNS